MFRAVQVRRTLCLLLLAALTAHGGESQQIWIRGIYTGTSPRPVCTGEGEAWQRATTLAENLPQGFVLIGSGRSMQPLYDPGTILVLRHLPFEELQRGQTVLYRSQQRKIVAHVLVTKTRDGWRTQGLNNASHDMEPVRADNLVGIVVAAFKPVASPRPVHLASLP